MKTGRRRTGKGGFEREDRLGREPMRSLSAEVREEYEITTFHLIYDRPPESFPEDLGVYCYNAPWDWFVIGSLGPPKGTPTEKPAGTVVKIKVVELDSIPPGYPESWLLSGPCRLTRSEYQLFKRMTDKALQKETPTTEDLAILEESFPAKARLEDERPAVYVPLSKNKSILFQWVYYVWRDAIRVKRCKAKDCGKIFIPARSDQQYCCVNCRTRAFHQRTNKRFRQRRQNKRRNSHYSLNDK